jgi:glycosyltransferase involved in cell wall biosynthesis
LALISVIIPAYNAEERIEDTLRSVMAQDYEDIEVIVVNDASTDKTAEVARRVLEENIRPWRIIEHEKNQGISVARNTGLEAAQGEYVQFMDADDLVDRDFLSTLYELASKNGGDIAFCGLKTRVLSTGAESNCPPALPTGQHSGEDLAGKYLAGKFMVHVCAMISRREFLSATGVKFWPGCTSGQDSEFIVKALSRVDKVVPFSTKCLYTYLQHGKNWTALNNTPSSSERKVRYSSTYFQGMLRASQYLLKHAKSPQNRWMARHMFLPKFHLKVLHTYAWRDDRAAFDQALHSPQVRSILWSSGRAFLKNSWPENFVKTLLLFVFPSLYYKYRRAHVYTRWGRV